MYLGSLPAVSNKATYEQSFQINDDDTGDLIDLTGAAITFEIRDAKTRRSMLIGTVGSGITVLGTGVFAVTFAADRMRGLDGADYDVGCTITLDGETTQFITGTLPVLDGIVT